MCASWQRGGRYELKQARVGRGCTSITSAEKAGLAPTASLNGMRRSEKAEELEKA